MENDNVGTQSPGGTPSHSDTQSGVGTLRRWLLIAVAAALACVCVWAETNSKWDTAQGTYIGTLFLLAVAGVDWWRKHPYDLLGQNGRVRPELAPYYQGLKYLSLAIGIGVLAVMIIAVGRDHWQQGIVARSTGTGILFAGGTFAIGVLFGFLFGFPPAPSGSAPDSAGQDSHNPSAGAPKKSEAPFHTNLHEISDWLTKVIVGAGLVDLTRLPPQVKDLAFFMAKYTDPENPSPAVALAIMGYFSSCGVLFGYLWTRTVFTPATPYHDPTHNSEPIPSSRPLVLGTATSVPQG